VDASHDRASDNGSVIGNPAPSEGVGTRVVTRPSNGFFAYPENPPRERLEWLLALCRVLLVVGALLAAWIPAHPPAHTQVILISLAGYLGYSLAIVALVWRPLKFAKGWSVALHLFDLVAFSWLTLITERTTSPFFMAYVFLAICGTMRWQMWGALITGALSILTLAGFTWLLKVSFGTSPVSFETFVVRSTHVSIISALLGFVGAYYQRFQREISRLTAWPRRIPEDESELLSEVVFQCAEILNTPRVLLVWEERSEGPVNLAWMSRTGRVEWSQEPEGTYESLVAPRLERASFHTPNAADTSRVVYRVAAGFRECKCRPLNEALRARFDITAVQSWPLEGELTHGRLFSLDERRIEIDGLSSGGLVAQLAASRLDGLYMLRDKRQAVELRERVRLASDLHDSLLQSLAGTGLQLMVARRLIERDPAGAARKLDDIQTQIEQGEFEMRSLIRRLRPHWTAASEGSPPGLSERLQNLGRRVEQHWSVKLKCQVEGSAEGWTDEFSDEVFRIAREGILNAARHADASLITATFSISDGGLRLEISDDGRGFPFLGTYDLSALERMNQGPWSIKERVAGLQGNLELLSTSSGSRLLVTLGIRNKAG
jgi:signal transduction histidine kinase